MTEKRTPGLVVSMRDPDASQPHVLRESARFSEAEKWELLKLFPRYREEYEKRTGTWFTGMGYTSADYLYWCDLSKHNPGDFEQFFGWSTIAGDIARIIGRTS